MSLSSQVGVLATRVGTELKAIRNTYVPNSLRGPIGGVNSTTGASGTINLDPALASQYRLTATGDVTFGLMAAGSDGQRVLLEVQASGGQRILTFNAGYELSSAVPTRTFTVPSGNWAYVSLIYRSGTWRLVSAEPQTVADYSTPSAWVPADHGLLAWTIDPAIPKDTVGNGTGVMLTSAIKVSAAAVTTTVNYSVSTAGAGFTANRNYIGLYNTAGTLIAQTADLAATWGSSGVKTTPWASSASLTPGTYYTGIINTSTTQTSFSATYGGFGLAAIGRSAAAYRGGVTTTTYTALPATKPTATASVNAAWMGLG